MTFNKKTKYLKKVNNKKHNNKSSNKQKNLNCSNNKTKVHYKYLKKMKQNSFDIMSILSPYLKVKVFFFF